MAMKVSIQPLTKWRRLGTNLFEALFAVLGGLLGALTPFANIEDPASTSSTTAFLREVGPGTAHAWGAGMVLSAVSILAALSMNPTRRITMALEVFGLVLMSGLLAAQALVLMDNPGTSFTSVLLRLMIMPGFLAQVRRVLKNEYLVVVKADE